MAQVRQNLLGRLFLHNVINWLKMVSFCQFYQ